MLSQKIGLVWFRGGLRLQDNACLQAALKENSQVYCCFLLDDHYMRSSDIGAARAAFLFSSLNVLATDIAALGGELILRRVSDIPDEIVRIANECGASNVYANLDYLPYPISRDKRVQELLQESGKDFKLYNDQLLVHPNRVFSDNGSPYTVFTPFKRKWEMTVSVPERFAYENELYKLKTSRRVKIVPIPVLADYGLSLRQQIDPAGEHEALKTLSDFKSNGLSQYHHNRDLCALPNSTSRLSMHLKWGTVSIRDCYRAAYAQGGPGAVKWIDELAWREFYYAVAFHFPHVLTSPMLKEYDNFPWNENMELLAAWKEGMTGYPFVDAGMRQLNATGWMHNRLRQVVASYLCKDLLINWQEGERYFMQMLTDGDWPANNGGWQWVSGSGTDPRRATRIFNPVLQQQRYDSDFEYVRRWVPEYGTTRYPQQPIVNHEEGRRRYLDVFAMTAAGRSVIKEQRRAEELERRQELAKAKKLQGKLF